MSLYVFCNEVNDKTQKLKNNKRKQESELILIPAARVLERFTN
jgi:hypothetical protein